MPWDRCPVCPVLSVRDVGVVWPNGWMDQDATWYVASRGVRLAAVNTGSRKSSFEHVCARVTSRDSSCIVLLIYRPGSRAADASFFTELSDLLDRLVTFVDPIMVVGDLNIRLDRPDDPHSRRLLSYWRRTTGRAACHRRHTTMAASSTLC